MYPVSPAAGVGVRLPLKAMAGVRFCARRSGNEHTLISGSIDQLIVHDYALDYRYQSDGADEVTHEFVIRYFPASSRYQRDPGHPAQRALTERFPLINYARAPLWLVRGEDRAENDFVTGFQVKSGYWTAT